MNPARAMPRPGSKTRAAAIQNQLRSRIIARDRHGPLRYVAGVDAAYPRGESLVRAGAVVLELPELTPIDKAKAERAVEFPYIPGYLSFREAPAILDALAELDVRPDAIVCDGHGLAHPRRFGLACYVGVLTDTPCVGAAKTGLIGEHDPLAPERGSWTQIRDRGEAVGAAVRTRTGVKPVYVSVGHRVSLATAVDLVLRLCPRYRLPETTRLAHALASD